MYFSTKNLYIHTPPERPQTTDTTLLILATDALLVLLAVVDVVTTHQQKASSTSLSLFLLDSISYRKYPHARTFAFFLSILNSLAIRTKRASLALPIYIILRAFEKNKYTHAAYRGVFSSYTVLRNWVTRDREKGEA